MYCSSWNVKYAIQHKLCMRWSFGDFTQCKNWQIIFWRTPLSCCTLYLFSWPRIFWQMDVNLPKYSPVYMRQNGSFLLLLLLVFLLPFNNFTGPYVHTTTHQSVAVQALPYQTLAWKDIETDPKLLQHCENTDPWWENMATVCKYCVSGNLLNV